MTKQEHDKQMLAYRLAQVEAMYKLETSADPDIAGYGANLSHWHGGPKPINLDKQALAALARHYRARIKKEA